MVTTNAIGKIEKHVLFDGHTFFETRLPEDLVDMGSRYFMELWELHPAAFFQITQPVTGRRIPLPRWQQAYGHDYRYTGSINCALPVPDLLKPFLDWSRQQFDDQLNGLLLNWYDAAQQHYIGAHSDSIVGLVSKTPIVTISLGAARKFRLRSKREKGFRDFDANHGTVFVLPWDTNLHIKHEIPHRKDSHGRRISITARAFVT